MKIRLRFFAGVREALGVADETVTLPAEVRTVGAVRDWLRTRGAPWTTTLAPAQALRMAYDHNMTEPDTVLAEGGEVAFFPPVTGG